jgi:hypothetical protein
LPKEVSGKGHKNSSSKSEKKSRKVTFFHT